MNALNISVGMPLFFDSVDRWFIGTGPLFVLNLKIPNTTWLDKKAPHTSITDVVVKRLLN